ncbi:MAG TPA: RNA polymerase sigma factor [Candidatus Polarisedimenticolaceae bacterium]|nr:RNA polymerase sigma factor [Candidatus Polarisedimenticolaceae bacterium]
MTTVNDSVLMTDVRDGRAAALGTLFERHHARLYRFCLRMTGNRSVSEDLVQEIFMRILRHRATFRPGTAFVPWMYRIARNACIDHLRRGAAGGEALEEEETLVAGGPSVEETVERGRAAQLMRRALLRLPVERRAVLLMSRYEFKTYEEIARTLDCSVSAVKIRAYRAIKQLREVYCDLAREAAP